MSELKVQYDDGMCAVEECPNEGRPQVCPYDRRYHHHGKIHYQNGHPFHPELRFREGLWRGVCNAHMEQIDAGAKAKMAERIAAGLSQA